MRKHHEFHPITVEHLEDRTALSSLSSMQVPASSLARNLSTQVLTPNLVSRPSFNFANVLGSFTSNPFSNLGAAGNPVSTISRPVLGSTGILNTPTTTLGSSASSGTGATAVNPVVGANGTSVGGLIGSIVNQTRAFTPSTGLPANPFSNFGAFGNLGNSVFTTGSPGTRLGLPGTGILNTPTGILGGTSGFGTGSTVVSPGLGGNSASIPGLIANIANQASMATPNSTPGIGLTATGSPFSNFGTISNLGSTVATTGFQGTRVGLFGTGMLNTPTGILGTSTGFNNGISFVSPGLGGIGFMGF